MEVLISIIVGLVFFLGLLVFIGQTISVVHPKLAEKLGVADPRSECDPVYHTYERGVAMADVLISWTMPVACVLYFLDNPNWVYFGMVGGSVFFYYFGLITFPRLLLQKRKVRMGGETQVKIAYVFATLWGLSGLFMIVFSIKSGTF